MFIILIPTPHFPILPYVMWKSGVTFVRRCFRDVYETYFHFQFLDESKTSILILYILANLRSYREEIKIKKLICYFIYFSTFPKIRGGSLLNQIIKKEWSIGPTHQKDPVSTRRERNVLYWISMTLCFLNWSNKLI